MILRVLVIAWLFCVGLYAVTPSSCVELPPFNCPAGSHRAMHVWDWQDELEGGHGRHNIGDRIPGVDGQGKPYCLQDQP
jgi:hypothetical protein